MSNHLIPHWYQLWKHEKFSSLAPPLGIFYKTQWVLAVVKLTRLRSIFNFTNYLPLSQLRLGNPRRALEWREHYKLIFENVKPVDESKNHTNIISTSLKVVLIFKIRRVWPENWACHAHFWFGIKVATNPSILQLESSSFGFK